MILGNPNFDVRKTNRAIDELLKTTSNPRHRFMLEAYHRHRYLEIGGRAAGDECYYPDVDLHGREVDGEWRFLHKDGRPY